MDAILIGLCVPGIENHSLAVLRGAAVAAGFDARVAPFSGWRDMGDVARAVLVERPRLVGISLQNTEAALASLSLARILRGLGYRGRIVCGGHFATLNAEDILRSPAGVDVVVRFAGEAALVGLLRGEPPESLAGALWVDGETLREGAPPELGRAIPREARPPELPQHLGFPAADLVVSRGCEAHCAYCCVAGAGDELRRRRQAAWWRPEIADIADEIAWLWHERGARVFNFMDDNLLPLEGAEAFLRRLGDELARRRVGRIAFSLQLRADAVTDGVSDALVELGLARAYVGIDGFSAPQLRQLGRHAPAEAAAEALDRLADRGVYCLANALLLGPTIPFESLRAEIDGLARVERAPVHLLPIDARAGTRYFERARERGLMEGGFLWRHYRFEDRRTARVADLILSMPTRLVERSVPIALYDLGYNLGIARRLLPSLDLDDGAYRRISEAWNRDQLRLLRAAAEAAMDDRAIQLLKEEESERVRAHDEALVAECDAHLAALERAVSRAQRRTVEAHSRGRILSSVALAMGVAACRTQPFSLPVPDAGVAVADLGQSCPPGRTSVDQIPMCLCPFASTVRVSVDQSGVVSDVTAPDGSPLPPDVKSCLDAFFQSYCFPSLAGKTQEVLSSHCWVA
jgi:hypothetical protein